MKILLFSICSSFFLISFAFADTWVANVSWNSSSGISNCWTTLSHWITHYGVPNTNNASPSVSATVSCQTHAYIPWDIENVLITWGITSCWPGKRWVWAIQIWASWYMRCQSWDDTPPIVTYQISGGTTQNNTWTNSNVTSSIVCNDIWRNGSTTIWSWCTWQQYRKQSTPFSCNSSWTWINGSSYTHTTPSGTNLIEYICFRSRDNAWNTYSYSSVATIKIDRRPPAISDITNSNPPNFLANNNYLYQFSVWNNLWAPIVEVQTVRERHTSESIDLANTCNSFNCSVPWNISRVDNFRLPNGSREYTLRVTRICDEAGNCWNGSQDYTHNVYANTLSTNIDSSRISEQLSDAANIARWNGRNIVLSLRDQYGNAIIPASGIGRSINFRITADNNLRLNQYADSGFDSALFAGTNTTEIPVGTNQVLDLNERTSSNGEYTIPFYIFAPTSNADSLVPWNALINSIAYSVNRSTPILTWDNPQNQVISDTNIWVQARPLFTTNFTWEIIDNWFIEWADQNSNIEISRAFSEAISSPSLRLEFGEVDGSNQNILNNRFNIRVNSNNLVEWNQSNWTEVTQVFNSLNPGTRAIQSRIIQEPWSTPRDTNSYLASIISYNIAWKTVVYPHAIIWKDAYYGTQTQGETFQRWAKIIGLTSSQRTEELTTDQFMNDVRVLWSLTKAELRRDIQRNVSQITRNIEFTPLWNQSVQLSASWWGSVITWWWEVLLDWDILYFRNPSGPVRIWGTVHGNRTLIVENGDVYINQNIVNDTSGNNILWIITLNWNVYIDPSVTDVHASMFVDRSIMSYNNWTELDGNTPASALANQLYIFWSVFSENTLWTSRSSIPLCPFYIPAASCNLTLAQKYDFNYLRRYFVNATNTPSWVQSQRSLSDATLRDFPVIIEYNPAIQTVPPPLFDIQK